MSKKDRQLLLIVFGILIAFASWQFVFKANQEKADKLKTENSGLNVTVSELEALDAKKDEYLAEIDRMQAECTQITNSFASGILAEDEVMYLYNMELADSNEAKVSVINMNEAVEVLYGAAPVENTAETDTTAADDTTTDSAAAAPEVYQPVDEGIRMYDSETTVDFTTTYGGLKNVVRYVYEMPTRKAISSVNLVAADNGYLSGSMNVNFYCMLGTEVPYSYISIPGVPTGTDNIFGVRDGAQNNNAAAQDAEEVEAEDVE